MRTRLLTEQGWLDFQEYFVHRRCEPVVQRAAVPGRGRRQRRIPDFIAALADPALEAVVICPSNPFISVEPILAIPGVREAMMACQAPIIAVSPIIAGRAVKGPTAKMMTELGLDPTAGTVAQRYADLLDGYVIDHADMSEVVSIDARVTLAQTLMTTIEDREALARIVHRSGSHAAAAANVAAACGAHAAALVDVWACRAGQGLHRRQAAHGICTDACRSGKSWQRRCWRTCWRPWPARRGWPASWSTRRSSGRRPGRTLRRARGDRRRARRPYRRGERDGPGADG